MNGFGFQFSGSAAQASIASAISAGDDGDAVQALATTFDLK